MFLSNLSSFWPKRPLALRVGFPSLRLAAALLAVMSGPAAAAAPAGVPARLLKAVQAGQA